MAATAREPITTAQFVGAAVLATLVAIFLLIGVTGAAGLFGFGVVFLLDRNERQRPLRARDFAIVLGALLALVVIVVVSKRTGIDDWPPLRNTLRHPGFVITMWVFLIVLYVRLWRPWAPKPVAHRDAA